jgi:hypothetical protein
MRSFLGISLLAGLFVVCAGAANAGDFSIPLDTSACGEIDIAEDAMEDPSTAFLFAETPELCQKLCKRSRRVCNVAVNDVISCYLRYYSNIRGFGKLNCESANSGNPDAIRMCKENTNAAVAAAISNIKLEREFQHDDCEEWGAICSATCIAP